MAFDESRLGGDGFEIFKNGIEPLDVADLQNAIVLPGQLDEFGGLGGVVGHRFFHQHMLALLQQRFGQIKMRGRGRDDVQGVAGGGGFGDGIKNARTVFGGDFARGVGVGVEDAGEFHLAAGGEFGVDADVVLSQRAGAEDGDFDL